MDDDIFEKEAGHPEGNVCRMAVRICTEKECSQFWFYKNLNLCMGIELSTRCLYPLFGGTPTRDVVLSVLRDWEKVTKGGPWTFRGNPVLLASYVGFMKPSMIMLYHLKFWLKVA